MDKGFQKDNMEDFVRNAFEGLGDEPSADGWDSPSDGVWEGIRGALPMARTPWWAVFGIWTGMAITAMGLLVLLSLSFFLHNRALVSTIEQQVLEGEELQLRVDSLQEARAQEGLLPLTTKQTGKESRTDGPATRSAGNSPLVVPSPPSVLNAFPATVENQLGKKSKFKNSSEGKPSGPAVEIEESAVRPSAGWPVMEKPLPLLLQPSGKELVEPAQIQAPLRVLGPIPSLSLPKAVFPARGLPATKINPVVLRPTGTVPGFYLGAYVSSNFTSRDLLAKSIGAEPLGRPIFEAQEQGQGSIAFGLKAGTQLSRRWALESGVGTYNIRQQSRQLFRITFDPRREQADGTGALESTYALAVPSAYGASDIEVDIQRAPDQQVLPGEAIGLEVVSQQQIRFVSIPLTARYDILSGRFRLGIRGGLALNFLQATSLQTAVRIRRSGLQAPEARVRQRFSEVRHTNLDYILGLSARYRFSPALEAVLEPTFQKNLKPVTNSALFSTRSYSIGVQVGANYSF